MKIIVVSWSEKVGKGKGNQYSVKKLKLFARLNSLRENESSMEKTENSLPDSCIVKVIGKHNRG